jgi:D-alanine-D-alanine ligase
MSTTSTVTASQSQASAEIDKQFIYDFHLLADYLDVLRQKLRLAVVYGGDKHVEGAVLHKTHNPRSWKSYEAVARDIQTALRELGFRNVALMPDDMRLSQRLKEENVHLVWLNTGGVQGYSPVTHTPSILEMLGIPYVGHNPLNSTILDNKHLFKYELQALGINTAPFITWNASQGMLKPQSNARFVEVFGDFSGPFVVKPVSGRASLLVSVVKRVDDLTNAATEVFRATNNTVVIEKYLPGREFCVSVCGGLICTQGHLKKISGPFAFSPVERSFEPGEEIFTSMDKKAITAERAHLIGDGEALVKQQLLNLARKIYSGFSLNALVRADVRADTDGTLYVLEANPKPDLKRPENDVISLVTIGLSEHQMSYSDLIYGMLADRLDYMLTYRTRTIQHIVDLLK